MRRSATTRRCEEYLASCPQTSPAVATSSKHPPPLHWPKDANTHLIRPKRRINLVDRAPNRGSAAESPRGKGIRSQEQARTAANTSRDILISFFQSKEATPRSSLWVVSKKKRRADTRQGPRSFRHDTKQKTT